MNERNRQVRKLGLAIGGLVLMIGLAGCEQSSGSLSPTSDPKAKMGDYQKTMNDAKNKGSNPMMRGGPGAPPPGTPGGMPGMPPGGMRR